MAGTARIGISGWTYAPWRGMFFPEGLRQKEELSYASRQVTAIEINGTFYGLQKPDAFRRWASEVPDDFVFTVKGPRYITHILRGRNAATPLANFFASGVLALEAKLGAMLWQFPPNYAFDEDKLESFLALLPHDTKAAAALAARHDDKVEGFALTHTDAKRPLRHAIEIRHESFRTPRLVELLRRHDVALVCADTVDWPRLMDLTSDFVYCRLHGSEELYASGYGPKDIDAWAARIRAWTSGRRMTDGTFLVPDQAPLVPRDVFLFFDNTIKPYAPKNAIELIKRLQKRR